MSKLLNLRYETSSKNNNREQQKQRHNNKRRSTQTTITRGQNSKFGMGGTPLQLFDRSVGIGMGYMALVCSIVVTDGTCCCCRPLLLLPCALLR